MKDKTSGKSASPSGNYCSDPTVGKVMLKSHQTPMHFSIVPKVGPLDC